MYDLPTTAPCPKGNPVCSDPYSNGSFSTAIYRKGNQLCELDQYSDPVNEDCFNYTTTSGYSSRTVCPKGYQLYEETKCSNQDRLIL